ncbi:hypothetical protein BGX38DRAFT_1146723 [Terfezia claveryi]|nr:hypothetical protein BGX38DRAFT_1146723 [Terfezia claveryi]
MSPASSIGRSAYQTHRRNISVPIMSSSMIMTPPVSPPLSQAPGNPASTITNMSALRRPLPAHLNLSTMSSPTCQPVVTHNRHSQPPRPCNPYEIPQDDSQRSYSAGEPPHDYVYNGNSFDLHSGPASPVSPVLHSAFPLAAAGDESLIDRWLRHEAMGRPIFPGSRTGSSVATSDISSLRGGMFGSLPGGRATRPLRCIHLQLILGYITPTLHRRLLNSPRSFVAPCSLMSASNASVVYNDETAMGSTVTLPEPAATRPPRYSDSLAAPPYQLPLAELINNGTVGYQAVPILTYGTATAATEKSLLGEMLNNPVGNSQSEGVVVMAWMPGCRMVVAMPYYLEEAVQVASDHQTNGES